MNDTLYRCLDHLLPLKSKIEQHVKQRFRRLIPGGVRRVAPRPDRHVCRRSGGREPRMRRGDSCTPWTKWAGSDSVDLSNIHEEHGLRDVHLLDLQLACRLEGSRTSATVKPLGCHFVTSPTLFNTEI